MILSPARARSFQSRILFGLPPRTTNTTVDVELTSDCALASVCAPAAGAMLTSVIAMKADVAILFIRSSSECQLRADEEDILGRPRISILEGGPLEVNVVLHDGGRIPVEAERVLVRTAIRIGRCKSAVERAPVHRQLGVARDELQRAPLAR